ncbi:winged helix-turn-helix domain-containing protein [Marinovum sp.]|uniref:winged helix-turn-helix domain-containing protein n=1 Tax=Marinovum sp. TaxID=2024839 RepID=UPI003A8ED39C
MEPQRLSLGACSFDLSDLTLRSASGARVPLRAQSMRVLAELAKTPGAVVSRDALIEAVWTGTAVTDDSLAQCVKDIRAALSDQDHEIVKTVVGRGYSLTARSAPGDAAGLPKVLVERFRTTGGNVQAEELAEALFEELVIRLTRRAGVRVLTDTAFRPGARYIIGGRATVRGEAARVFVKIERGVSGEEVHAGTDSGADGDIWTLAGRVADRISALLRVHMIVNDGTEAVSRDDAELSVQELLDKAGWHMNRFRRENWVAARRALTAAVSRAPENPVALAMLASMQTQMIPLIPFAELPGDVDTALELSERAVELGQTIDYVLRTRGNLRLWCLGDHDGARLDCARALKINPVYHQTHLTLATSEVFSGDFAQGEQRLQEMMQRAPEDPQNPLYISLIALARLLDGRREEALAAAREGCELNPWGAWNALVYATALGAVSAQQTSATRKMVRGIDLPADHFRHLPIVEAGHAEALVAWARTAGVAGTARPSR